LTLQAKWLEAWLVERLATIRAVDKKAIDPKEPFNRYGLESVGAGRLVSDLSTLLGRPLSPTLAWEFPSVAALARHLVGEAAAAPPSLSVPPRRDPYEPIAIVGMACRFPKAPDLGAFWDLLVQGGDAIGESPPDRWDATALFDPDTSAPGKLNTRWGGFLDRVDLFDPQFFGISPREAVQMDPQQRLVLELAWEALEDAGIPPPGLKDSRTGVFIGALFLDYALLKDRAGAESITTHSSTGGTACIIANRVSYVLGLQGPSLTVDTACSSSLVAVHLACQSLRSGESNLALAGGVNLMLVPETTMAFTRLGAMSPDGRSRAFGAGANGYVRSEGAGIVALKRLSDALRDGDSVYAVVRGSAVNNDGASNGLTAPNPKAQEGVLRDACAAAGVAPADVHYVEAHGTGTPLGDPIEASGLGAVFGAARSVDEPLLIGSAKTNVGHLEAAAGVVGLVKVALAMRHDVLPPSLHFEAPNPHIDFDVLHLSVVTRQQPWPGAAEAPRRAGVSSFGYGGTNSHVILESVPRAARVSAQVAETVATTPVHAPGEPPGVVWVFSGQGSQWAGMGRSLVLGEPAFSRELVRCERALLPHLGWSVFDEIVAGAPRALPNRIDVTWPVLFAFQVALAELLRSLGLAPAAVIGHSIGEVAAAHVAGALSLEDAARVIAGQATLVQRAVGAGTMLLAGIGWEEAQTLARASSGRITAAIAASPVTTVLSGDRAALAELEATLHARGVFVRPINTGAAVHGPQMDFLEGELSKLLAGITPGPESTPVFSTVTSELTAGRQLDGSYWVRQLRQPVRFAEGIARLLDERYRLFLEVSPHPIVKQSIEECIRHRCIEPGAVAVATLVRGEDDVTSIAEAIGQLRRNGASMRTQSAEAVHLLPVSGRLEPARAEAARRLAVLLEHNVHPQLPEVCFTASARRPHHRVRGAIVARSRADLLDGLRALATGREHESVRTGVAPLEGAPKLAFVFSGQGSQWIGMGQRLLAEEPVFRAKLEECDALLHRHVSWSLLDELAAPAERSRLGETEVVQPALFAIQVALVDLLRSWGVTPDAVIGHSIGEVAAAYVAGALSLPEAARLVAWRGRIMQKATGLGKMAWIALPSEEAMRAIAGREAILAVAAINDPGSVVLSGETTALEEVVATLSGRGTECRPLKVNYAFHSPQMDPLARELVEALGHVETKRATIPLYSTVTGTAIEGTTLDAAYWGHNVREPVQFASAMASAVGDGHRLYLEVGPHPVLSANITQCLASRDGEWHVLFTLRRDGDERVAMLDTLGGLYARGVDPDWSALHPAGGRPAALPTYPWQRERYWVEAAAGAVGNRQPRGSSGAAHPLLGRSFAPASQPGTYYWEQWLSTSKVPYLADYSVQGQVVFPVAGYLEMALAAASEVYGESFVVEALLFESMLALREDQERLVQVSLVVEHGHTASLAVASRDDEAGSWEHHAHATVREATDEREQLSEPPQFTLQRCPKELSAAARYAHREARQIHHGPSLQGVEQIWVGTDEVVGRIRLSSAAGGPSAYRVHPALLDACLQVAEALIGEDEKSFVPVEIASLRAHHWSWSEAWVRATPSATAHGPNDGAVVDLAVVDERGRPLLDIVGLQLRPLAPAATSDPFAGCRYTVAWRPKQLALPSGAAPPISAKAPGAATWIVFADAGGIGAAVAEEVRSRGDRCIEVAAGPRFERRGRRKYAIDPSKAEDYQRLFREVLGAEIAFRGVVHCWNLDASPWEETTPETLLADVRRGSVSVLHVVQELVWQGFRDAPRLVLVTRGAQAVGEFASELAVAQGALWGLGRTIAMEQPDLACTRVDLDPTPGPDEAAALVQELFASDGEDQIALRAGQRLVARLERGDLEPAKAPRFDGEGSYLITGGLGGLGLTAARWLVSSGARHLLLVGRSEPSDQAREAIRALNEAGADVRAWRADVARAADVESALVYLDENMPPLRGILHAAGVLEDRTLQEMGEEQFTRAIRPKILGAWNLHAATRELPLEFFVMYSSVAALLGPPGQGNYAAANTFLDALAHARAAHGLPAMSIQWGSFSDVGMAAAQENRGQRLAHRGIDSFTPGEGMEILARLIRQPWGEVGVIRLSVRQWVEFYPRAASAAFLSRLRKAEQSAGATKGSNLVLDALRGLSRLERRPALERHVVECLGRVLRLPAERIEVQAPFRGYGMDSLMSLEIRNRLEASLGLRLSAALLFTYPTTATLVDHLLTELHLDTSEMDESVDGAQSQDAEMGTALSEAVAVAMLDARLNDLENYLR
jgi:acyl transferase domain-containing protein/acyl carrier protein